MNGWRRTAGLRALALIGAAVCALAMFPHAAGAAVSVEVLSAGGGTSGPPSGTYPNETLADAVAYAESQGGGTITFAPSLANQTINLTVSLAQISYGTTITGPSGGNVVIGGGGLHTLFDVAPSTSLTVSGLFLTGGVGTLVSASEYVGGAIYGATGSTITVKDSTISGNTVNTAGGAIASEGTVDVQDSTINGNQAPEGGGIYGASTTITGSAIFNNTASVGGGGVFSAGNLTVTDSTFSGNHVLLSSTEGAGGAILQYPSVASSGLQITSSTIVGNKADGTTGVPAGGGGIYINANNPGHPVQIYDTIVAGNSAGNGGADIRTDGSSPTVSASFSLIGNPTDDGVVSATSTDLLGSAQTPLDPQLGPLKFNGGPTETMLPMAGSPAIDAGVAPSGVTTDQRGDARTVKLGYSKPGSDGTDIGAAELQASEVGAPTVTSIAPSAASPGELVTITGTNLFPATQVMFGFTPATKFIVQSPTQITAYVPAGAHQVDVRVIAPAGESAVSAGDLFTYATTTSSTTFGNQALTLVAPSMGVCAAATSKLTASFTSKIAPGAKGAKLKFKRVAFYIDRGVKQGKAYKPNATSPRNVTVHLSLKGQKAGTHTLKVVASYREVVQKRTKTLTKTLKRKFRVC